MRKILLLGFTVFMLTILPLTQAQEDVPVINGYRLDQVIDTGLGMTFRYPGDSSWRLAVGMEGVMGTGMVLVMDAYGYPLPRLEAYVLNSRDDLEAVAVQSLNDWAQMTFLIGGVYDSALAETADARPLGFAAMEVEGVVVMALAVELNRNQIGVFRFSANRSQYDLAESAGETQMLSAIVTSATSETSRPQATATPRPTRTPLPTNAPTSVPAETAPADSVSLTQLASDHAGLITIGIPAGWDHLSYSDYSISLSSPDYDKVNYTGTAVISVSVFRDGDTGPMNTLFSGSYAEQLALHREIYSGSAITETTVLGDPTTIIQDTDFILYLRDGADGTVYRMELYSPDSLNLNELVPLFESMFESIQVATAEPLVTFTTASDQAPAFVVDDGTDLCASPDGEILQTVDFRPDEAYVGMGSGPEFVLPSVYGSSWRPAPGTTITVQLLEPPAWVSEIKISLVEAGYEWLSYETVVAAGPANAPLTYTFDNRPAEYVIWLESGNTGQPLYLSAICGATPMPNAASQLAQIKPTQVLNCPGLLSPRLQLGERGRITPGLPNNLNTLPSRPSLDPNSIKIGSIPAGGVFTVLNGPVCGEGDGIVWWEVSYEGMTGWTGESGDGYYWAEPID